MAPSNGTNGSHESFPRPRVETGTEQEELEPLLGRPGDAIQASRGAMAKNLILGTGILAQFGAFLLLGLIWSNVFLNKLILFSGHPLAQSLGIFILTQSILTLQPTHTPEQKRLGQRVHASLNLLAFLVLVTGVIIIEYNKFSNNGLHFHSIHGTLGVITFTILILQYIVGFTMWATPSLYGGEGRAKSIWKYHRWSGYTVLLLLLTTVAFATDTDYNKFAVKYRISLWATLVAAGLIVVGIFSRIQKQKLGL